MAEFAATPDLQAVIYIYILYIYKTKTKKQFNQVSKLNSIQSICAIFILPWLTSDEFTRQGKVPGRKGIKHNNRKISFLHSIIQ